MYMILIILSKCKCIQLSHLYLNLVPLRLKLLLKTWYGSNSDRTDSSRR